MLTLARKPGERIAVRDSFKGESFIITHRGRGGPHQSIMLSVIGTDYSFDAVLTPGCHVKVVLPRTCKPVVVCFVGRKGETSNDLLSFDADHSIRISRAEQVEAI